MAATSAAFVTSALWARASPPSFLMSAAVSSAAAKFTSAQKTFAPSRANATAVALPLPQPGPAEPAPTTSAIFPFNRSGMFSLAQRVTFAQFRFQNFSVVILRQRVDEDIILRPLEARDAFETKRVEFLGVRIAHDVSDDDLAPLGIRAADHRYFADFFVREQDFLDLARIDGGAAGDDHVLGAILQREVALGIEDADVAGVQPTAFERRLTRLWTFPIARHHHVALAQNLAGHARRQGAILVIGDFDLDASVGSAGGAELFCPARMIAIGDFVPPEKRDRHRAFALAVDLREAIAEAVDRLQCVLDIHRRAAPNQRADRGGIAIGAVLHKALDHRGGREHRGPRPVRKQRENLFRLEGARFRHDVHAETADMRNSVEAGAMAEGCRVHDRLAGCHRIDLGGVGVARPIEIAMREHGTL